jgi:hypothetical protein
MMNRNTDFIELAENAADNSYMIIPIPHPVKDVALWHLLTTSEDMLRMVFVRRVDLLPLDLDLLADNSKYSLKYAIPRIFSEARLKTGYPLPKKTIPDAYRKATKLIKGGFEYKEMVNIFSLHHSKHHVLTERNGGLILNPKESNDSRYFILERFQHGAEDLASPGSFLYQYLARICFNSVFDSLLSENIKVKDGRVVYRYAEPLVYELLNGFPQQSILIPKDFIFPWGNDIQTLALINSLQVRCCYHLIAISLADSKFEIRGGFESSLVLCLNKEELVNDLEVLASVGRANVVAFIDCLTYGIGVESPDPSLQPLIKAENGVFMIPCFHVVTCNMQRNILTLMTRIDSRRFNSQSNKFELMMIDEINKFCKDYPDTIANRVICGEEVDYLIVDKVEKKVLVMELRWMIQPGDPREISNRINACLDKVAQLKRKLEVLRNRTRDAIKEMIGINSSEDEWDYYGIVVIDGYGGTKSSEKDIPLITLDALSIAFSLGMNVESIHQWVSSLEWLPSKDTENKSVSYQTFQAGNIKIDVPLISPDGGIPEYQYHLRNSAQKYIKSKNMCS